MPTQNVNLSDRQANFIRRRVKDGGYRNASEVVRAGLRLLEQNEKEDKLKLRTLRRLAEAGFDQIDRGDFELVEPENIGTFLDKLDERAQSTKS
jgi:antitoxin ParD1/3/4